MLVCYTRVLATHFIDLLTSLKLRKDYFYPLGLIMFLRYLIIIKKISYDHNKAVIYLAFKPLRDLAYKIIVFIHCPMKLIVITIIL